MASKGQRSHLTQPINGSFKQGETGNFGDCKQIDPNLYEIRFFFGGGLRIYYTILDGQVVLLLAGGDKSTQSKDIATAKKLLSEMEG